jgi:hypothetical protein
LIAMDDLPCMQVLSTIALSLSGTRSPSSARRRRSVVPSAYSRTTSELRRRAARQIKSDSSRGSLAMGRSSVSSRSTASTACAASATLCLLGWRAQVHAASRSTRECGRSAVVPRRGTMAAYATSEQRCAVALAPSPARRTAGGWQPWRRARTATAAAAGTGAATRGHAAPNRALSRFPCPSPNAKNRMVSRPKLERSRVAMGN